MAVKARQAQGGQAERRCEGMRRVARENLPCALAAAAASATMAWLGLYGFAWTDYEDEAKPAFDALIAGHLLEFLRLAPAYGGSLVERAPFAILPSLWGGGALAVYRMAALPCLLAAAVLGTWLCARMRTAHRPALSRAVALSVCVANPLTLRALELGHPEELLGACLCVAALLLAASDRPLWAGTLLGLAIANKEWALLAAGPVLLVLPERSGGRRRRVLCLTSAGAVAAAVLAPLALVSSSFTASTRALASPASPIFQPWQIWWFFGHHGRLVHGLYGAPKPGYRTYAPWAVAISHPLIPAAGILLVVALWLTRRRSAQPGGAVLSEGTGLLALALLLLLRCLLDTWDVVYYSLPFIFALLAWEIGGPDRPEMGQRPPAIALSSTVLAWMSFQWLPANGASADLQAAFFLAWTLPLCAWLALALYAPGFIRAWPTTLRARPPLDREPTTGTQQGACAPAQEMTVSSLGSPLRTSRLASVTTTRSSIRTPS
jgi:glycosyl transferase family 87